MVRATRIYEQIRSPSPAGLLFVVCCLFTKQISSLLQTNKLSALKPDIGGRGGIEVPELHAKNYSEKFYRRYPCFIRLNIGGYLGSLF